MVITKTVPQIRWRRVLDDLSRVHSGATVRLGVLDGEQRLYTHGDTFTLGGLTFDGDAPQASVAVMLDGQSHITHIIDHPQSMNVELSWETRTAKIQIASENGTRTLISLGPPVWPGVNRKSGAPAVAAAGAKAALGPRIPSADSKYSAVSFADPPL